jgi:hypothetical protein
VPAIVVGVLIVIVVVAVILSSHGGSSPGSAAGTAGATTSASPKASASASTSALTERQAAAKLSGLLSQSGTDRADVNTAYYNVQACRDLAADTRVFNQAAANRRTLLAKLKQLPGRSALSAAMLTDLTAAWQASATVDTDLGKWASAAVGHCHKGNPSDPSLIASTPYDNTATSRKQAFVTLWNRLAHKDSLTTVTVSQL